MNLLHRWICNSGYWKRHVEGQLLPWGLDCLDLGDDVLEIGPGYGLTTDILRTRTSHLTCVEVDGTLAHSLSRRMAESGVTVIQADGVQMPFPDASFSAVVCFTMLHHVPSMNLQNRLLAEAGRVLRPGGVFAGTDSTPSVPFRLIHVGDTMIMVNPKTFPQRLQNAGFIEIQVETGRREFRFRARQFG